MGPRLTSRGDLRRRSEMTPQAMLQWGRGRVPRKVGSLVVSNKGNVLRTGIQQVNAHPAKLRHDPLHGRPAGLEDVGPMREALLHDILGEFRRNIEVGGGEVQDVRPRDDGHLDHEELFVMVEELRHVVSTDLLDGMLGEAPVACEFTGVEVGTGEDLDGGRSLRRPEGGEDHTILAVPKAWSELEPTLLGIDGGTTLDVLKREHDD